MQNENFPKKDDKNVNKVNLSKIDNKNTKSPNIVKKDGISVKAPILPGNNNIQKGQPVKANTNGSDIEGKVKEITNLVNYTYANQKKKSKKIILGVTLGAVALLAVGITTPVVLISQRNYRNNEFNIARFETSEAWDAFYKGISTKTIDNVNLAIEESSDETKISWIRPINKNGNFIDAISKINRIEFRLIEVSNQPKYELDFDCSWQSSDFLYPEEERKRIDVELGELKDIGQVRWINQEAAENIVKEALQPAGFDGDTEFDSLQAMENKLNEELEENSENSIKEQIIENIEPTALTNVQDIIFKVVVSTEPSFNGVTIIPQIIPYLDWSVSDAVAKGLEFDIELSLKVTPKWLDEATAVEQVNALFENQTFQNAEEIKTELNNGKLHADFLKILDKPDALELLDIEIAPLAIEADGSRPYSFAANFKVKDELQKIYTTTSTLLSLPGNANWVPPIKYTPISVAHLPGMATSFQNDIVAITNVNFVTYSATTVLEQLNITLKNELDTFKNQFENGDKIHEIKVIRAENPDNPVVWNIDLELVPQNGFDFIEGQKEISLTDIKIERAINLLDESKGLFERMFLGILGENIPNTTELLRERFVASFEEKLDSNINLLFDTIKIEGVDYPSEIKPSHFLKGLDYTIEMRSNGALIDITFTATEVLEGYKIVNATDNYVFQASFVNTKPYYIIPSWKLNSETLIGEEIERILPNHQGQFSSSTEMMNFFNVQQPTAFSPLLKEYLEYNIPSGEEFNGMPEYEIFVKEVPGSSNQISITFLTLGQIFEITVNPDNLERVAEDNPTEIIITAPWAN